MIIGVEAVDNELMISYFNEKGKISFIKKKLIDHELFNWVESDKPSLHRNWDGKYVKKAKSDAKWLTRTRLEELIIEKLTPEEKELIYSFDNTPKKEYLDIEIKLTDSTFPDPGKVAMPVGMISFCNEEGVNYVLSIMDSNDHPNGLSQEEVKKMAEKARAEPYKGKAYADTGPAVSEKTNRPFGGAGGMGAMPKSGVQRTPEFKSGGKVSSASKRADGCATKGKTKGRMV